MRSSGVDIGPVGPQAAADIAAVKVAGWRTTYAAWVPAEVLAPFLDEVRVAASLERVLREERNVCLAAHAGSEVVGFALCVRSGQPEPLLDSFHVLPEARGAGLGGRLLRELAVELLQGAEATLAVAVVEQNAEARRLYERLGAVWTSSAPAPWAPRDVREAVYRWDDLKLLLNGGRAVS